jgi:hypothetical protein
MNRDGTQQVPILQSVERVWLVIVFQTAGQLSHGCFIELSQQLGGDDGGLGHDWGPQVKWMSRSNTSKD